MLKTYGFLSSLRSVPAGIDNPEKGLEISLDPLLRPASIFLLTLINAGDAKEAKQEVPFQKSLLSSTQSLIDFLFFRNVAGQEEKNRRRTERKHFIISSFAFPPGGPSPFLVRSALLLLRRDSYRCQR